MADAADRTGPNLALLNNSAVDATPVFPFYYTPKTGFTPLDPAITYGPVANTEAVFSNITPKEVILAICEARNIMVTNKRIVRFGSGWGTASTHDEVLTPALGYHEMMTYTVTFSAADKDNLTVTITASSGDTSTATLTFTDLFAGNPVWHLGFPTDAQLANVDGLVAGYDVKLVSMSVAA